MTLVYQSSSGDTWDIVKDQGGAPSQIRHTPNNASGGKVSEIALADFLKDAAETPEHQAVVAFLDQASDASLRGYIHDPKEIGGPYIAVVLAPNDNPNDITSQVVRRS